MGDEAVFFEAYDAVLRQWPVQVRGVDVPSPHGSTRVQICGREDGPPVVLLPGGGATSAAWFATVGELAPAHRVYAVDLIGDIGRSVHDGAPLRGAGDLVAWLDALFDELGLDGAHLCGHSYGAWIALNYALHAPRRLGRLVLLDPVNCFAGMSPRYLLHGLPTLLRPTVERMPAFHEWETGRPPEDPVWREFLDSTAFARRSKVVAMRRPKERDLRACAVPTLVVLAERSRAHSAPRTAAAARRLMPGASVVTLPGASHHSIPTERPAELNGLLAEFLA
ncbi:alpha/beta hydrolase [Streptomyces chartreusis]|jgi:pimeloyl-ACP methyl ester carboxylesterase|uniref:alpha/beta fold hydrolase n=1 Tax=Streptomyces chartreusis TaxID=1969 RepID=UPI003862FF1B|nr:alpha/beta hydrolase [Streptomyces chartreusis]